MYVVEIRLTPDEPWEMLHDVHSPVAVLPSGDLTQLLNAVNDFRFDLLPAHPLFHAAITPYVSLIQIWEDDQHIIFRGRIVDTHVQMTSSGKIIKSFVAECELAFLLDSYQDALELRNVSVKDYLIHLLSVHNRRTADDVVDKQVTFVQIEHEPPTWVGSGFSRTCRCGASDEIHHVYYGSTFENIKDQVLHKFGGFIKLSYRSEIDEEGEPTGIIHRVLHYSHTSGRMQNIPIELAVNLDSVNSHYHNHLDFTRLIPLGAELERYELGIARLQEVGLIGNPDFWLTQVQYFRDEVDLLEAGHFPISEWTGQLLLGLSKLNYKNPCICEDACNSGGCEHCTTYIREKIKVITPDEDLPPDINSRYSYNLAIDLLANSGVIGSPGYWKEEKNASRIELRWLIRLAALTVNPDAPQRGSQRHSDDALNWLPSRPIDDNDNDDDDDDDTPPILAPPDDEGDDDDALTEVSLLATGIAGVSGFSMSETDGTTDDDDVIDEIFGVVVNRDLSPWIDQLMINISRLNFRRDALNHLDFYRREIQPTIDDISLYQEAIDSLANANVIHSPSYWKESDRSEDIDLRWIIRLADQLVDRDNPLRMTPQDAVHTLRNAGLIFDEHHAFWLKQIGVIESDAEDGIEIISQWFPELLVNLTKLNVNRVHIEQHIKALQPRPIPDVDDEGAYQEAIDSLANAGAIGSPTYWKDPVRRSDEAIRWLIRLADATVDYDNPQSHFPRPRLTIEDAHPEGKNWLPVIESDVIIEGTVVFNEINDPIELKKAADQWIKQHKATTHSINVSAIDLSVIDGVNFESFQVGDYYTVENQLLEMHAADQGVGYPLIQKQTDIVNPMKSSLTFGDRQLTMSTSRD
ncbi:MAG: hypothetical protein FWG67_00555 [Defluviitaleaceae bacterium]|nr:hypothetical protein [Defluviitaleaceae bacterium]